jgi:hypothetical protein
MCIEQVILRIFFIIQFVKKILLLNVLYRIFLSVWQKLRKRSQRRRFGLLQTISRIFDRCNVFFFLFQRYFKLILISGSFLKSQQANRSENPGDPQRAAKMASDLYGAGQGRMGTNEGMLKI